MTTPVQAPSLRTLSFYSLLSMGVLGLGCGPQPPSPKCPDPVACPTAPAEPAPVAKPSAPEQPATPLEVEHTYTLKNKSGSVYTYTSTDNPLIVEMIAEDPGKSAKCLGEFRCHFWRDEEVDKWHVLLVTMEIDKNDTRDPVLVVKWAKDTAPYLIFEPPVPRLDDNTAKTSTFTFPKPTSQTPTDYVLVEPSPAYRLTVKAQLKP